MVFLTVPLHGEQGEPQAAKQPSPTTADSLASLLREYEIRRLPGQRPQELQGPTGGVEPGLSIESNSADLLPPFAPPTVGTTIPLTRKPKTALQRKYVKNVKQAPGSRRFFYRRTELFRLIGEAFGIDANRIYAPPWISKIRYEIYFETNNPNLDYHLQLRRLLVENFRLSYRREMKPVETLVLRTPRGEPPLPVSKAPACTVRQLFSAGPVSGIQSAGFRGCRVGDTVRLLQRALRRTVINETTTGGRYDFQLSWNAPRASVEHLARQLSRKLGADLVAEVRPTEVLLIDQARRLEKPVRYRAEAKGPAGI